VNPVFREFLFLWRNWQTLCDGTVKSVGMQTVSSVHVRVMGGSNRGNFATYKVSQLHGFERFIMSTALKVYENNEIAALDPNSEAALAFRENNEGTSFDVSDLIRVKVPSGGGTIWTIEGPSGKESVESIEGVIVFKAPHGVIWRSDDPSPGEKPVVVTNDLVTAKLNIPREEVPEDMMESLDSAEINGRPGVYDWAKLPQTQWGTGKKGHGKYAKEQILLFILRPNELLPLFLAVPSGSIKNLKKFFLQASLPYYRMLVSLKLKEEKSKGGIKYSQIIPTHSGTISPENGLKICEMYRDPLRTKHEAGLIELDRSMESEDSAEG
jgi:hypothetical protein